MIRFEVLRGVRSADFSGGGAKMEFSRSGLFIWGGLAPCNTRSDYSLAGFVYSSDFILITKETLGAAAVLDRLATDDGRVFTVASARRYKTHTEYVLEEMKTAA